MAENEIFDNDEQKVYSVQNAGICLFSPFFLRLFSNLGYLNEDYRDFKDTKSRIRAIFLLQYLTYCVEKDYREVELVFNRMLVSLPMEISLPKQVKLTSEEKEIAIKLINSLKENWRQMRHTSINALLQSFIERAGRLEEQEEKWVLTVENRAYDILLDYIPWGFKLIRLPWLKKYIQVVWNDKQES